MNEKPRYFQERRRQKGLTPKRLTLELSYACNLSCPVCPRSSVGSPPAHPFMDKDLAFRIIVEAAQCGIDTLVPFFRGEALLHPDLLDILAMARKAGMKTIQLATNATLLSEAMARGLLETGLDFISFSIDTMDEAAYELKRKNGRLGDTLGNIAFFLALREKTGSDIEVQVSAVDHDLSAEAKKGFVDYWLERVDRVRFYPRHSEDGSYGKLAKGVLPELGARLPCLKLVDELVILCDGTAALCNHDWEPDCHDFLGQAGVQSLVDIFNGNAYERYRKWHGENNIQGLAPCGQCDHWKAYYLEDAVCGELFQRAG